MLLFILITFLLNTVLIFKGEIRYGSSQEELHVSSEWLQNTFNVAPFYYFALNYLSCNCM